MPNNIHQQIYVNTFNFQPNNFQITPKPLACAKLTAQDGAKEDHELKMFFVGLSQNPNYNSRLTIATLKEPQNHIERVAQSRKV